MTKRKINSLFDYSSSLVSLSGQNFRNGDIFAKVLTANDDSGRHGVLIPPEVYEFFPELIIADKDTNATTNFIGFDCITNREQTLAYKYYQRYPERRVTCLNGGFNDREHGLRVAIFLKAEHADGSVGYYIDLILERVDANFEAMWGILFGTALALYEGGFSLRAVDAPSFHPDESLNDLLARFDEISARGWIDSLREGDTGIGYTFESLVGIEENNDRRADYKGIEIKCKQVRGAGGHGGKINLFQQAPAWENPLTALERLYLIGQPDKHGRYACYSQVTTTANNLGLWLNTVATPDQVEILKGDKRFGYWLHSVLAERLREKHSRAVFVKAEVRKLAGRQRFYYKELVYCERPSIQRFNDLIQDRRVVFEFLMSEKEGKQVRNHGYPWRLTSEEYLSDLFSLRVKLR
jgi:hypothetical protein